jgi:hypothetical protein
VIRRWWQQLLGGTPPPEGFDGPLDRNERVLGSAPAAGGGHLVATSLGLWLPKEGGHRRIGWHLVSKATWDGRALTIIEADEVGSQGDAVLIADRPPRRFPLPEPGAVPEIVHARVTRSVLQSEHRQHADGRELVVRRRVPGRDGIQVQIRRDLP